MGFTDYVHYGMAVPPSVPIWFLLPFILCLLSMFIAGQFFNDRDICMSQAPTWLRGLYIVGFIKVGTYPVIGLTLTLMVTFDMSRAYQLPDWMPVTLIAMAILTWLHATYSMSQSFIPKRS